MARAIWTGSISFGLVEIPVSLQSAENPRAELKFNLIHKSTMRPVGYVRVDKSTGKEVPWNEIVRGYEYEKGEYVVLSDEELDRADADKSHTIDIVGFVDLAEIEPVYFERPYYLEPVKKGSKGYALLLSTLERTKKAGIAQVVLRTRQYLAAMMPRGPVLSLVLLRYADEVGSPDSLKVPKSDRDAPSVKESELKLAEQLVAGMTMKWDPDRYHDSYREDVMELIERKFKTGKVEEIREEKPSERAGDVLDLMPLLKKSLETRSAASPRTAAPHAASRRGTKRARKGA